MHTKFKLSLQTPESFIFEKEVESIYFTTKLGDMMVLPDHASISTVIDYSSLFIKDDELTEEFIIQNGLFFFSNKKNHATILCYSIKKREEIDYSSVKNYLKLIEEKLANGQEDDLSQYQYKFLKNEQLVLVKQIEEIEMRGGK